MKDRTSEAGGDQNEQTEHQIDPAEDLYGAGNKRQRATPGKTLECLAQRAIRHHFGISAVFFRQSGARRNRRISPPSHPNFGRLRVGHFEAVSRHRT
jgi:hypothetical protein